MLDIKDAVAVITGGARGIGFSIAKMWLEKGGKVVIGDVMEDQLKEAETSLKKTYPHVVTVRCDVTNEDDCAKLADTAVNEFGSINLVVPGAGIIKDGLMVSPDRETGKVTGKMSLDQFQSVINVNLTGVFLTIRECSERMINNGDRGLVCLISSTGSLGTAGQINYSSTKAAVSVMPKVVTAEFMRRGLGSQIRCVAIAPGYVATDILKGMNQSALEKIKSNIPIGRLIEPEEISSLACELFRNEALAGEVFFISGGLRLASKG